MGTIPRIPDQYLCIACIILSFLLFQAGGTAFNQSVFYGSLFIILAMILFFAGVYFGRKIRPSSDE